MKERIIISSAGNCVVELIHGDSDPLSWIVRRWRKYFWFKKRLSSDWFNDRDQALAFANELGKIHDA
jgi:hypothetical protein